MGKRAVFYARVSTEEERQLNALEKQIQENKRVIEAKGWSLVDSYIDEGKSGTTVKHRDEYQRLLEDLEGDKFDIVVIKSQDRLNRNTKDWFIFVDRLVSNDKKLFMYIEDSFYKPDNNLITGIKAILAEEYSRELSKKINNANNNRLERARKGEKVSVYGSSKCYGYKLENGENTIIEEEAEVVRLIYKLYLDGKGGRAIRRELTARGITNHNGNEMNEVTIINIIKNERYTGTLVTNMYHKDFYTKKTVKNPPEEWIKIENAVPPIISKEDYKRAQAILNSHRLEAGTDKRAITLGKNVGSHPLSGKIICGCCGSPYWKKTRADNGRITWICSTYAKMGRKTGRRNATEENVEVDSVRGCDNVPVYNDTFTEVLQALAEDLVINESAVKAEIKERLEGIIASLEKKKGDNTVRKEIEKLEKQKKKLTEAYLEDIITKEDYKLKYDELVQSLDKKKAELPPEDIEADIQEAKDTLDRLDQEVAEWIRQNEKELEADKLNFLLDHTSKVIVQENTILIKLDLLQGLLVATENNSLQYAKENREIFIHTEKRYLVPTNNKLLEVVVVM